MTNITENTENTAAIVISENEQAESTKLKKQIDQIVEQNEIDSGADVTITIEENDNIDTITHYDIAA